MALKHPSYEELRTLAVKVNGDISPPNANKPSVTVVTGADGGGFVLKLVASDKRWAGRNEFAWGVTLKPNENGHSWEVLKSGAKSDAFSWFKRFLWLIGEKTTSRSRPVDVSRFDLRHLIFFKQAKHLKTMIDDNASIVYATWWDEPKELQSINFEYQLLTKTRAGVFFKFIAVPMIEEDK